MHDCISRVEALRHARLVLVDTGSSDPHGVAVLAKDIKDLPAADPESRPAYDIISRQSLLSKKRPSVRCDTKSGLVDAVLVKDIIEQSPLLSHIRCVRCGAIIPPTGYVWQVMHILDDGKEMFSPTCSEQCARELQRANLRIHESRVEAVKNQGFQKMTAEDWRLYHGRKE